MSRSVHRSLWSYGLDLPNPSVPITVIGPISERKARIVIRGHVEALSVLFQPLGLHSLFGVPVSPLADWGFEGHSILGGSVSELYQRLGNAASFGERAQLLNQFLVDRLASVRTRSKALTLLTVPDQRMKVSDAAHQAGLSPPQLERGPVPKSDAYEAQWGCFLDLYRICG